LYAAIDDLLTDRVGQRAKGAHRDTVRKAVNMIERDGVTGVAGRF